MQEEYNNLTSLNNVSIRAQATDLASDTIEILLNGVSPSQSRSESDVYFPITGFNESINYTMVFQSVNNTGQLSNISDPFSLCKMFNL